MSNNKEQALIALQSALAHATTSADIASAIKNYNEQNGNQYATAVSAAQAVDGYVTLMGKSLPLGAGGVFDYASFTINTQKAGKEYLGQVVDVPAGTIKVETALSLASDVTGIAETVAFGIAGVGAVTGAVAVAPFAVAGSALLMLSVVTNVAAMQAGDTTINIDALAERLFNVKQTLEAAVGTQTYQDALATSRDTLVRQDQLGVQDTEQRLKLVGDPPEWYTETDTSIFAQKDGVIVKVDLESGESLTQYTDGDNVSWTVATYSDGVVQYNNQTDDTMSQFNPLPSGEVLRNKYGPDGNLIESAFTYETPSSTSVGQVAAEANVDTLTLIDANPTLAGQEQIPAGTRLWIPLQKPTTTPDNTLLNITTNPTAVTQTQTPNSDAQAADINTGYIAKDSTFTIWMSPNILNSDGIQNTAAAGIAADGIRPGDLNSARYTRVDADYAISLGEQDKTLTDVGQTQTIIQDANGDLYVDPLVLDLNGDGVKLTDYVSDPVLFDIDNDGGTREVTGWVSPQDGILVMDLNTNGQIDNIKETFSEYFNGQTGSDGAAGTKPYSDGFAALKSQDSNSDNVFNSSDAAWSNVKVWVDADHDGRTDSGELKTLSALNITQINLAKQNQSGLVKDGNEILASGSFVQGGVTKEALAISFLANPDGHTVTSSGTGLRLDTQNGTSTYVAGSAAGETIDVALKGVMNAYGNIGNDTLNGNAGNNWLIGSQGADTFNAGAGNDVLVIDAQDLPGNIHGGAGLDTVQVVGNVGIVLNLAQSEIETVQGGRGDDVIVSGGYTNTFVAAGEGNDLLIGGTASDALSGEAGDDVVDGGDGNDVLRGHRGRDRLLGGAGDDLLDGGQEDDSLDGGAGNDLLTGGAGDDRLHGGEGADMAVYSGNYADYRVKRSDEGLWVSDSKGRDGNDFLVGVERLKFADIKSFDVNSENPLPVNDVVTMANRTAPLVIAKAQLVSNDVDYQGDAVNLSGVLKPVGGTVALNAAGDAVFTPNASFQGVMSFQYTVTDTKGNTGRVVLDTGTGQATEQVGTVYLQTPDLPQDASFFEQWYINASNVLPVWKDYTGKGVKVGIFDPGSNFAVTPEVFDYRNADLAPNVDRAWLLSGNPPTTFSQHATAGAGIIGAARNKEGTVGVAYEATLAGEYIDANNLDNVNTAMMSFKNYDVVNNSYGFDAPFTIISNPSNTILPGITNAVQTGRVRNGEALGTVLVFATGNARPLGDDSNTSPLTNNPYGITVGAINAPGDLGALVAGQMPFSTQGASILVSAPGSNMTATSRLITNDNGTTFGATVGEYAGSSFAAPVVSGVVALMLEANPNLGYRDVQEILALSAKMVVDPNGTDWVYNGAKNWNGGGMHVSHDYGFGQVDALAAVRLAEVWQEHGTYANLTTAFGNSGGLNASIPDGSASLISSVTMGAGAEVESATVVVNIDHARWGDLTIKLISPSGNVSVLVDRPGKAPGSAATDYGITGGTKLNVPLTSTHVRGELSGGTWRLEVADAASGQTGVLRDWQLYLQGRGADANNIYYYTDEFAALGTGSRATLTDNNGGSDILNAAAVSGNSIINLNAGATSTIAGRALTLAVGTQIEYAYGGDGNDILTGNGLNNSLDGGRGNDTLNGDLGQDLLRGMAGNDTYTGGAGADFYMIEKNPGSVAVITDFTPTQVAERLLLVGFGEMEFPQIVATPQGGDLLLGLGEGQSVLLKNVSATQFTEQAVMIFRDMDEANEWLALALFTPITVGTTGTDVISYTAISNPPPGGYYAREGNDTMIGNGAANLLDGGAGNDWLEGMPPNGNWGNAPDWLEGGAGNDFLRSRSTAGIVRGGSGDDILQSGSVLSGGPGDDFLEALGQTVLHGGTGRDTLQGSSANNTLFVEGDLAKITIAGNVREGRIAGDGGSDRFIVLPTALGVNTVVGPYVDQYGTTVYDVRNIISDFNASDANEKIDLSQLPGVKGMADLIVTPTTIGGFPFATVQITTANGNIFLNLLNVTPSALNANNFIFATTYEVPGATRGNDVLNGDAGGNILDGRAGADVMTGRTGDDVYIVDNASDAVIELADGGFDTVRAAGVGVYTLPSEVENLELMGNAAINGNGNPHDNRLTGNTAANRLDGRAGQDTLLGGAGNDVYTVDNTGDRVIEYVNEGYDVIESAVSYALPVHVEAMRLTGALAINATGNDLNNTLTGNASANTLDGGVGADAMTGGNGDDVYLVDNASDSVTELANQGNDTVYAWINYTLGSEIENLTLGGTAVINGTGNALDNVLTGNAANNALTGGAGNDVLDGHAGGDVLRGGTGDDLYVIDASADSMIEDANEGTDTVQSSVTWTLGNNLENLILTGNAAINGTGNGLNNTLLGNTAKNTLIGSAGDDILDGGLGTDTLIGGTGNDSYFINDGADVVTELAGEGTDTVNSTIAYTLGTTLENLSLLGLADLNGTGNASANVLRGNSGHNFFNGLDGNDTLQGHGGNDTLYGGNADDTLDGGVGNDMVSGERGSDIYLFNRGDGQDTLNNYDASVGKTDTLLFAAGIAPADIAVSRATDDLILAIKNTADSVRVLNYFNGDGTSIYKLEQIKFANGTVWNYATVKTLLPNLINGTTGNDVLTGTASPDAINGLAGTDTLSGRDGNDILNGGTGNDTLSGELGSDTYLFNRGDGQDTLNNYDLGSVKTDTLKFDASVSPTDIAISRSVDDLLLAIKNTTDTVRVLNYFNADGLSVYKLEKIEFANGTVWDVNTVKSLALTGGSGSDTLIGYASADKLNGLGGNDVLYGRDGNDTLDGGAGNDTVSGELGSDTYLFSRGGGQDTLNNYDTGSSKTDVLLFAAGIAPVDIAVSRATDDLILTIKNTTDSVRVLNYFNGDGASIYKLEQIKFANGTVWDYVTVQGMLLQSIINGTAGNDVLTGTAGPDVINGLAGNDTLDGGAGADTLNGGAGNDLYRVDNRGDGVVENLNEGTDTVQTALSYTLGANVENLTLTGSSVINGSGNALSNVLTGNNVANVLTGYDGNDTLNGGGGADTLVGGLGNDTYVIDNSGDIVAENANEGTDTVQSSLAYTLGATLEHLTLTGSSVINGGGNALDNVLTGNSAANVLSGYAGNDTLNGGSGADTLIGGLGNDIYVVDNAGDIITENAGEGTDTVQTWLGHTLGANVENLTLTGGSMITGTGNALNNTLTGNSVTNTLNGGDGNDTLDGGAGGDTLNGGLGNDTYLLGRGYGSDTITENDTTTGNADLIRFLSGIATDQIWFRKVNTVDLEASIIGTGDKFTLKSWYSGSQYHVEQFKTADGKTLLDSKVDSLVSAMAAFAPPASGQTTLPPAYSSTLAPVIAANWV